MAALQREMTVLKSELLGVPQKHAPQAPSPKTVAARTKRLQDARDEQTRTQALLAQQATNHAAADATLKKATAAAGATKADLTKKETEQAGQQLALAQARAGVTETTANARVQQIDDLLALDPTRAAELAPHRDAAVAALAEVRADRLVPDKQAALAQLETRRATAASNLAKGEAAFKELQKQLAACVQGFALDPEARRAVDQYLAARSGPAAPRVKSMTYRWPRSGRLRVRR